MTCIYTITNLVNGNRYIGSAAHYQKRKWWHTSLLNLGRHHNSHLQAAWRKYGAKAFGFAILSLVHKADDLIPTEQAWIDGYQPEYNICRVAGSSAGRRMKEDVKQRLSKLWTGISRPPFTTEHRAKLSAAWKGRVVSESERKRLASYNINRVVSEETKAKLRVAFKGRKHKPESIALLRSKATGRKLSPETRAKLSLLKKGKPLSAKHRAALDATRIGRKHTLESIQRMRTVAALRKRNDKGVFVL